MGTYYDEDGISLNPDISNRMSVLEKKIPSQIIKNALRGNDLMEGSDQCDASFFDRDEVIHDIEFIVRDLIFNLSESLTDTELAYLITSRIQYHFDRDLVVESLHREASPPMMDFECINNNDIPNNRFNINLVIKDENIKETYEVMI